MSAVGRLVHQSAMSNPTPPPQASRANSQTDTMEVAAILGGLKDNSGPSPQEAATNPLTAITRYLQEAKEERLRQRQLYMELYQHYAGWVQQAQKAETRIQQLEAAARTHEEALIKAENQGRESVLGDLNRTREALTKKSNELGKVQNARDQLQEKNTALKQNQQELTQNRDKLKAVQASLTQKVKDLTSELGQSKIALEELKLESNAKQTEADKQTTNYRGKLQELETGYARIQQENAELSQKVTTLEAAQRKRTRFSGALTDVFKEFEKCITGMYDKDEKHIGLSFTSEGCYEKGTEEVERAFRDSPLKEMLKSADDGNRGGVHAAYRCFIGYVTTKLRQLLDSYQNQNGKLVKTTKELERTKAELEEISGTLDKARAEVFDLNSELTKANEKKLQSEHDVVNLETERDDLRDKCRRTEMAGEGFFEELRKGLLRLKELETRSLNTFKDAVANLNTSPEELVFGNRDGISVPGDKPLWNVSPRQAEMQNDESRRNTDDPRDSDCVPIPKKRGADPIRNGNPERPKRRRRRGPGNNTASQAGTSSQHSGALPQTN